MSASRRPRRRFSRLHSAWQSVFPRPRQPVTWRGAWQPIAFLVLFALVCLLLERGHVLMFARPWRLGFAVLGVWVWWMYAAGWSGLPRFRGAISCGLRLGLLAVLVMVLAEPRAVRTRDVLSVVYLMDVSDSIKSESADQSFRYITSAIEKKPGKDEAGLIVFGKTPAVELPPRQSFPFDNALNTQVDRGSTNVEQSLSLGAAMLPEDNQGRLVLLSDGVQTEGNLSRILDDLKSRGVAVDVLPIDYSYEHEVWLERLELPQAVKLGEKYEAAVILSAMSAGEGVLKLRENGELIGEASIKYQEGKNRFTLPISLRNAGYYEYTASIETDREQDSLAQNNTVLNYIFVEGAGKILLVTDPLGDERDWKKLEQAIKEGERAVQMIGADEFPRDAASLLPYDAIIFVNVAHDLFDAIQLHSLKEAVYNYGCGFLMVGGPNSFGPGGYHRTAVEEILPVSMDVTHKKVLPKGALAIILHTCEFPEGNTWAKRITKQAIKVLGAQDDVGVLIYGPSGEDWVFKLTPAGKYDELVPLINSAQPGDMPSFARTMQLGIDELKLSDASSKHMIIISDGDPQPPPPPLVADFIKNKISVSMVAVFPHGGNDISAMRGIATSTGGRYYFPQDPNQLPAIFIKESKTLKRSMVQLKRFTPEVGFVSPVLKGIDGLPELGGYVITTRKPHPAMVVLEGPQEEGEDEGSERDPILAIWQHGLGKTAAFTSDLSPSWGADWVRWGKYQAFVTQLLTEISRVRKEGHLRMSTYTAGGDGVIVIEDFHNEEAFLSVNARVTGPGQKVETLAFRQVGPRRYEAAFPLWGHGRYHVTAQGTGGERSDNVFGGFVVSYSPEYLRFRSNRQALADIATRTGGRVLSGDPAEDNVFATDRESRRSTRPVFDWFLMALAILLPLDVALRRVQLDWSTIKSWVGLDRRQTSTVTMGTLLQRKAAVATELRTRREERPYQPSGNGAAMPRPAGKAVAASKPPPRESGPPPATDGGGDKPTSTTERLLALKRKRDEPK